MTAPSPWLPAAIFSMFPSLHSDAAGAPSSLLLSRLQINLTRSHTFHLAFEFQGLALTCQSHLMCSSGCCCCCGCFLPLATKQLLQGVMHLNESQLQSPKSFIKSLQQKLYLESKVKHAANYCRLILEYTYLQSPVTISLLLLLILSTVIYDSAPY